LRVRNSDFVRHGALVFAALMAANVLQFVFYSVLSRVVGVEQYGVLTSLFSATLLIATGPATVAGTIVARLSADLRAAGDMRKIRRLGDVVTGSTALIGFGAFLLAVALAAPIAGYLRLASTQPVIITGVALGLSFAIPVQRGIFQGTEKFGAFALSNIVEAAVKVIAGSLLALRFGVNGALAGLAIAFFLSWSYNVVTLRSLGSTVHRLTLDVRRIVLTSMNVTLAVLAVNALLFYDVILVRHYFSAVTAGLYGAAALVARAMYTVIAFIPTIVLPKASARRSDGRRTGSLLIASLGTASLIIVGGLAITGLFPRFVVTFLAGRAFADAGAFVLPYTFALGALALANVTAMYNIGLHRFDFVVPVAAIALGEIIAVVALHQSVAQVLFILCIGHALALAATLIPNRATLRRIAEAPANVA
jgi:O-antigen/teichoic acid export membrane protein